MGIIRIYFAEPNHVFLHHEDTAKGFSTFVEKQNTARELQLKQKKEVKCSNSATLAIATASRFERWCHDSSDGVYGMTLDQMHDMCLFLDKPNSEIPIEMTPPDIKSQSENMSAFFYYHWMKQGRYNFDNKFQRGLVWDQKRQMNLIDSLRRGMPGININLNNIESDQIVNPATGQYYVEECIDGKQRSEAIRRFFENELPAIDHKTGIAYFYSKPGKFRSYTCSVMCYEDRRKINSTMITITTTICEKKTIKTIFDRLQSGVALTQGEILYGEDGQVFDIAREMESRFDGRIDYCYTPENRRTFIFYLGHLSHAYGHNFYVSHSSRDKLVAINFTEKKRAEILHNFNRTIEIMEKRDLINLEKPSDIDYKTPEKDVKRVSFVTSFMILNQMPASITDERVIELMDEINNELLLTRSDLRTNSGAVYNLISKIVKRVGFGETD